MRAQLQVGVEIVRILAQLSHEFFFRQIGVAGEHQRLGIKNVDFRQVRIQSNRLGELIAGPGIIGDPHLRCAQHQVRFCRISVSQNPIDQDLPLGHPFLANQRRAQKIGDGQIVWVFPLLRLQDRDDILLPAQAHVAVASRSSCLMVVGLLAVNFLKLRCSVCNPPIL